MGRSGLERRKTMANKQQLQTNNIDLSTILTTIGDLPIKALVEAAARVGKYAWKRTAEIGETITETVTNPSFSVSHTPASIGLSYYDKLTDDFFLGWKSTTDSTTSKYYYTITASGDASYPLKFTRISSSTGAVDSDFTTNAKYEPSTGKFRLPTHSTGYSGDYFYNPATSGTITFSFSGQKTYSYISTENSVDYVVSNTESAYPDGGTQDGYYYERVSEA